MNFKYILGIDEAGRGPLAGPVSIGGVVVGRDEGFDISAQVEIDINLGIVFPGECLNGIKDSKKLTEKKREEWHEKIIAEDSGLKYDFVFINNDFIDKKGMAAALKIGVEKLIEKLEQSAGINPENCFVLLDGALKAPEKYHQKSIIKGDEMIPLISAASVIAKVRRDHQMLVWHAKYPQYCFDKHKGYGTKLHYEKIKAHGFCEIHRQSFCEDLDVWEKL